MHRMATVSDKGGQKAGRAYPKSGPLSSLNISSKTTPPSARPPPNLAFPNQRYIKTSPIAFGWPIGVSMKKWKRCWRKIKPSGTSEAVWRPKQNICKTATTNRKIGIFNTKRIILLYFYIKYSNITGFLKGKDECISQQGQSTDHVALFRLLQKGRKP